MADIIIGNLPNPATTPLTGAERVPMDQRVGGTIAATALTPGLGYAIVTLGSTNWTACGVPAGVTPAVGLVFTCSAVGSGTGTAQQVETVDAAASEIAALAGGAISSAVAAHEAAANPHPNYTTQAEVEGIIAALTHLDVSITGAVTQHVRNDSGAPMAAGTPYHVVGAVGDTTRVRVVPARADNTGTMPANGILQGDLTATGANADGHGVVSGVVSGLNTSGGIEGATIWVGLTGGISTNRPASNPQPIGTLGRIHASTGTLSVAVGPVLSTVAFTGVYTDLIGRPPEISQADAEAGTAIAFSLWSAQRWRQAAAAWWQTVSSALGRSLVAAADASAARTILGLGTAAPLDVAASGNATTSQVVKGDDTRLSDARTPTAHTQAASTISDSTATGRAVLTAADPTAARSAIGAAGSGAITGSGLTMATARLLGRTTASSGAVEEISVSGGTFTGGILTLFDPASPGAIGGTTPASGTFTGLTLPAQATPPAAPATGFRLFSDASSRVSWRRSDGWVRTFDGSGITADRMWGLPDRSGTLALNGDVTLNTNLQQVFSLGGALGQEITAVSPGAGNTRLIYWNSSTSRWEYLRAGGAFSFISGVLHVTEPFIIPLSGEAQNITQNTVVLTVPYWQVSEVWPDNLIWQLNTAATGSAAQFDIRVGGTSIYATLPTISAGASNSTTATPAVYSSAFIAAGNTVAVGSSVTFHVIQVGATVAGAGLKVSGVCRRALS